MGGKNPVFGIAYVVVGGLCVFLGVGFTIAHSLRPRYVSPVGILSPGINLLSENWATATIFPGLLQLDRPLHLLFDELVSL